MSANYERESSEEKQEETLIAADIFKKIRKRKYVPIVDEKERRVRVIKKEDKSVILDTTLEDFFSMAGMSHDAGLKAMRMLEKFEEEDGAKVSGHG